MPARSREQTTNKVLDVVREMVGPDNVWTAEGSADSEIAGRANISIEAAKRRLKALQNLGVLTMSARFVKKFGSPRVKVWTLTLLLPKAHIIKGASGFLELEQ